MPAPYCQDHHKIGGRKEMRELIIWHFYKSNKILTIINPYMSERNYSEHGKSREPSSQC